MFCRNCGKENEKSSLICLKCGYSILPDRPQTAPPMASVAPAQTNSMGSPPMGYYVPPQVAPVRRNSRLPWIALCIIGGMIILSVSAALIIPSIVDSRKTKNHAVAEEVVCEFINTAIDYYYFTLADAEELRMEEENEDSDEEISDELEENEKEALVDEEDEVDEDLVCGHYWKNRETDFGGFFDINANTDFYKYYYFADSNVETETTKFIFIAFPTVPGYADTVFIADETGSYYTFELTPGDFEVFRRSSGLDGRNINWEGSWINNNYTRFPALRLN